MVTVQPRKASGSAILVVVLGAMTCTESEMAAPQVESLTSCEVALAPGASDTVLAGAPERTEVPSGAPAASN